MLNRAPARAENDRKGMAEVRSEIADMELLASAARAAAPLALRYFRQNPAVWSKAGGSPVSEADIAVDEFLRARLLAARPGYGWLSEETEDDLARLQRRVLFVVDPIDGTRGFLEGSEAWCISLAVVADGRPVAAALSAPALGVLYTASAGGGAWAGPERLAVSAQDGLSGARLGGPRGWLRTAAIAATGAVAQPHISSLAYRLARVATGRFDAAFASPRSHDWDLAASDLLVHEAGGRLTGLDAAPPRYNEAIPRHDVVAASNARIHAAIVAAIGEAGREVARGRAKQGSAKGLR
jgi:myo-inositol-1(or 4)-monophosphatase